MTELEAVNTLLSVIGEAPVSSLSDTGVNTISDAALANRTLKEVSRDVQSEGWQFNTDQAVSISRDAQKHYPLPGNVLVATFSPNRYADMQYVVRGSLVYDRINQTYEIGPDTGAQPLIIDTMICQLDWDLLPHVAQQYITIRAARIYSDRFINSNVIFTYTSQDEAYARSQLIRAEERQLNNNLLWGNDRNMGQGIGYIPAMGQRFRSN